MTDLQEITRQFATDGKVVEVKPFGNGLINDTYLVKTDNPDKSYLLQRINHHIFTDIELLQNNIEEVTAHIRRKLEACGATDIDRKVLEFIPARSGKCYYFDGESYWRMMVHIPRSTSFEAVTPESSRNVGLAFGDFQKMLADIPAELGETIPNFHNMEFRLQQFRDAVKADAAGRLENVKDLVAEVDSRADELCKAEKLHREGKLPKRVCHCDTKVNNILFDEDSGDILCVIDLDTVMPSYIFSDYGDFLRTAANTGEEDDANLDNVGFDRAIFEAFTDGYLESAGPFLTEVEIDNLPYAATLFPYMQFVRFLTDYINGDTYYKIKYPDHNLVRSRAQLKLLQSVEKEMPYMAGYVRKCIDK